MYACLIGKSPFEARSEETGGSLSICALGGDWRWPGEGNATKGKRKGGWGEWPGKGGTMAERRSQGESEEVSGGRAGGKPGCGRVNGLDRGLCERTA